MCLWTIFFVHWYVHPSRAWMYENCGTSCHSNVLNHHINYQLWTMLGFGINNKSINRRWVNRVGRYQIGWTVLMVISCKVYIRRVYSFISHSYWFRAELLPLIWSNIPCSRVCIKNFIVCNFKATKLHRNDKQYKNTTTQS